MKLKMVWMAAMVMALLLSFGCASKSPVEPEMDQVQPEKSNEAEIEGVGNIWPSLSQSARNNHLISYATQDIGSYGGQCKVYIQNLVSRVTDGRVLVPSNMSNYNYYRFMWNWDLTGHVVGQSMYIRNVQPGQIVQMSWNDATGDLHTFLVTQKTGLGMYVIDANWGLNGMVQRRYWSYSSFESLSNLRYSVYTIGW